MKKTRQKTGSLIHIIFNINQHEVKSDLPKDMRLGAALTLIGRNEISHLIGSGDFAAVVYRRQSGKREQHDAPLDFILQDKDHVKIGPPTFAEDPSMVNPPGSLDYMLYGPYDE